MEKIKKIKSKETYSRITNLVGALYAAGVETLFKRIIKNQNEIIDRLQIEKVNESSLNEISHEFNGLTKLDCKTK